MKLNWNIYTHTYKHIFLNFKSYTVIEEKSSEVDTNRLVFLLYF